MDLVRRKKRNLTFTVLKKGVLGIHRNRGKAYLKYYNLLITQDFYQAHYEILSIIFLKEFME